MKKELDVRNKKNPGRGFKIKSTYSDLYPNFSETPKAVIAAIAISLGLLLDEDDVEKARKRVLDEWAILYGNGIVKQKPRKAKND